MDGIRSFLISICLMQAAIAQSGGSAPDATQREYGWQVSKVDNALEYIVQLSPETVTLMQATRQEKASDMPPELVGRVTRTVVRIGTDILPRVPSLAVIAQTPRFNSVADIDAALQPGSLADIERNSVVNVQGGQPSLPSTVPGRGPLTDPNVANAIDQAARAVPDLPALANDFLSDTRGSVGAPAPLNNSDSKFQNTAPPATPPALPGWGSGGWQGGTQNNVADARGANSYQSQVNGQSSPQGPSLGVGLPPGYAMPGRNLADELANNQNLARAQGQGGSSANGNVGNSNFGINGQTYAPLDQSGASNPGYISPPVAAPIFAGTEYGGQGYSGQGAGQQGGFVGQGNGGIGFANGGQFPSGGSGSNAAKPSPEASPGDTPTETGGDKQPRPAGGNDNFLQVFFLLSLVINVYLGSLIRKLLTRYRSLLTSVRSQAA